MSEIDPALLGSDSEDSDYDPTKDKEALKAEEKESKKSSTTSTVFESAIKNKTLRKANEAYNELVEEDKKIMEEFIKRKTFNELFGSQIETLEVPIKSLRKRIYKFMNRFDQKVNGKKNKIQTNEEKKDEEIIEKISSKKRNYSSSITNSKELSMDDILALREASLNAAKGVLKKTKIEETVKFAGGETKITRSVNQSELEAKAKAEAEAAQLGIDQALEKLKGPKNINTLSKSSTDWDTFKEKEGIENDLQNASKEGYITRKEFLERCDVRAFEQEKESRLRQQLNN